MKSMNTIRTVQIGLDILCLLLLLALPSRTFAADNSRVDSVSRILQSSPLSKTEQAEVHARTAAAINAGVPAEDVEIIVSRSVRRGADASTINRFLDTGILTKQKGLPVTPVLDRIEQGLSKGVPLDRIASASQQLASKIAAAQPIVDDLIRGGVKPKQGNEREAAIEATARALEKSVPPEDLKKMGDAIRERKGPLPLFTSAANTVAYFAGSGMSAKTSSNLVQNAVENGYSERDLDGMARQINDQMMRGMRPEDAAMQMQRQGMQGGRAGMGPGSGMGGMGGMGGHR
jgi:hypothetical protein